MKKLRVDTVNRLDLWGGNRGLSECRASPPPSRQLDDEHEGRLGSSRENQAGIAPAVGVG
ncbi:MAG: hypothetical protein PSV46_08620 [Reyranella sp.]|nr:hypothetical protein [Reyranella sp.]